MCFDGDGTDLKLVRKSTWRICRVWSESAIFDKSIPSGGRGPWFPVPPKSSEQSRTVIQRRESVSQFKEAQNDCLEAIHQSSSLPLSGPRRLDTETDSAVENVAKAASASKTLGRWEEALMFQTHVFAEYQRKLGCEHLSTLVAYCELASTHRQQCQWMEALVKLSHIACVQEATLGRELSDCLRTRSMGPTYFENGDSGMMRRSCKKISWKQRCGIWATNIRILLRACRESFQHIRCNTKSRCRRAAISVWRLVAIVHSQW